MKKFVDVPDVSKNTSGFLRLKQVVALTGLSISSIYRQEKAGEFPPRILIGPRRVAWRTVEVRRWMDACPHVVTDNRAD